MEIQDNKKIKLSLLRVNYIFGYLLLFHLFICMKMIILGCQWLTLVWTSIHVVWSYQVLSFWLYFKLVTTIRPKWNSWFYQHSQKVQTVELFRYIFLVGRYKFILVLDQNKSRVSWVSYMKTWVSGNMEVFMPQEIKNWQPVGISLNFDTLIMLCLSIC